MEFDAIMFNHCCLDDYGVAGVAITYFFRDTIQVDGKGPRAGRCWKMKETFVGKNVGTFMGKPYIYLSVVKVAIEHQTDQ